MCLQPSYLRCSRCDATQYCSKQCQVKDWKNHKHDCCESSNINNLDVLLNSCQNYFEQGNYIKGEKAYRKLIGKIKENESLSNDQPFMISCLDGFACLLSRQGKYKEAIVIIEECITKSKLIMDADDPRIIEFERTIANYKTL